MRVLPVLKLTRAGAKRPDYLGQRHWRSTPAKLGYFHRVASSAANASGLRRITPKEYEI